MARRVTLSDVAKICGVTPATVSRVLNEKAEFTASKAVREKITQAARKMGYVPDLSARNLNRQETHIIGIFGSPYTRIAEGINESLLSGFASVLLTAGYDVFYEISSAEARKHAVPFWQLRRRSAHSAAQTGNAPGARSTARAVCLRERKSRPARGVRDGR